MLLFFNEQPEQSSRVKLIQNSLVKHEKVSEVNHPVYTRIHIAWALTIKVLLHQSPSTHVCKYHFIHMEHI